MSFSHESHSGRLPIRVLKYNITQKINEINREINPYKEEWYESDKVSSELIYDDDFNGVKFPTVDPETRQIHLTETYLAYLWAISYSLLVISEEGIMKPLGNNSYKGYLEFDSTILKNARDLFDWAMLLARTEDFPFWPKNLPNPEDHSEIAEDEKNYALKTNDILLNGMCFDYYHECGHLIENHGNIYLSLINKSAPLSRQENDQLKGLEEEADCFAMKICYQPIKDPSVKLRMRIGILFSQIAILFFQKKIGDVAKATEPDVDLRIAKALDNFRDSEDYQWACHFTAVCLKLFLILNHLPVKQNEFDDSKKAVDFYLSFFKVIKELLTQENPKIGE